MTILKQHLFLDTIGCRRGRILVEFDKDKLTPGGVSIAESLINEFNWPARYGTSNIGAILVPYGFTVEPEKPEVAYLSLMDDPAPWEKHLIASTSALFDPDDGLYKLWYQATLLRPDLGITLTDAQGRPSEHTLRMCYAYSEDGIKWVRPELPYYRCNGLATNMLEMESEGGTVFLDNHNRETGKFKALDAWYDESRTDLTPHQRVFTRIMASDDGISWRQMEIKPLNYFFDTQNIMDFDEGLGRYVAYMRDHYNGRAISRCEFDDPAHMPMPVTLMFPDNDDPADADYYTNGFTFYPHDKNIRLMFPSMYFQQTDQTTVRMIVSRNGRNFQWVSREDIILPELPNGDEVAQMYLCPGMLAAGDRVGMVMWTTNIRHDEGRITSTYLDPKVEEHRLYMAWWDRDRLAGLTTGQSTGQIYDSVKISGANPRLQLNMRSNGMGRVRVEVLAGQCFEPVQGYTLGDGAGLHGDHRWSDYSWNGNDSLEAFSNTEVTFRFYIESAKLFGYRVLTDGGDGADETPEIVSAM